jgi:porin-like protein
MRGVAWGLLAAVAACADARAEILPDIPTPSVSIGNVQLLVPVDVYGAGYAARQSGGNDPEGLAAAALVSPEIQYPLDNGWTFGLRTALLVYHDRLAGDNYGNDILEKAYAYWQTAYGRLEVGQQDGAAYKLEATGPLVAGPPAIDDANVTFFVDPTTGKAFTNFFPVRTGVFATFNDAKISYYSPRLIDLQVGVSFTPSETKGVPFLSHADNGPNRQRNIIEAGANYAHGYGRLTLHAYAGIVFGHTQRRTAGHEAARDWALGSEVDYKFSDDAVLAFGGAYRQSRGYAFDIDQSFSGGNTHAVHATALLTEGPWEFGFEYSDAVAGAQGALPRLMETGYEPAVGYALSSNLQLAAGYQHADYSRSSGTFYNGKREVALDAGFLYFEFKL